MLGFDAIFRDVSASKGWTETTEIEVLLDILESLILQGKAAAPEVQAIFDAKVATISACTATADLRSRRRLKIEELLPEVLGLGA
jgi:hypothetical protein